ncbi:anillin isoform X3 [Nasonia vitripennis]|uniref:PH domain-containing protein n=1 Tax=Nasonia vitripennis TaxID=7425 RepID=A0A7M7T7G6_NASVI|nr:anillin isoform X3 [Nasonia vitripennis]
MDPFTQRMLERARARREKLDTQLSNAGHDVKRRRSPLRDANAILSQAPVITDSILKKSPTKTIKPPSEVSPTGSPAKTTRISSPPKAVEKTPKKNEELNKENGDSQSSNVKSKLQRLGKLYSDDNRELSSPIHRTEEKFAVEDVKATTRSAKPCARLNRLAALASEINNWEDDLSHPTVAKPTITKAERVQAKLNEQVKNGSEPQPSTSGMGRNVNSNKNGSPVRPLKWDKSVLETLEAQGFSRSKSNSKLVYDYKGCSQGSGNNQQKSPMKSASSSALGKINEKTIAGNKSASTSPATSSRSNDSQHSKTPEKSIKSTGSGAGSPAVSNARMNSRFGYNGSPKSSLVQSPGSVLSKASMFESKGTTVKTKDPAEMTLSERKALFERNKGEALIPKAPLTMSVPTKMLQEKEKTVTHGGEAPKPKTETGKAIEAQRSIFEQGTRCQEMENNILQNVQAERQRELEMLRSRFNRNREIVQTAFRTSESSEGKPNSPKNSPVCPEQATPPPPPPLPSVESQTSVTPNAKTPQSKRQVVASPSKSNSQLKKLADMKRVKVSPPKPGHLYPDLTNIESSTTETETEFTCESTEAETATFDEPTDTETGTEGEYYVRTNYYAHDNDNNSSDDDEDDIGNTSLGRSILQAVSQQTAFNKKRSIDPDPDSTTSDISVLDEMDEYLDECLALQEVGEEGPTPPKLNRAGKSPSAASHSFKYTQGSAYRSPIKIISPVSSPRKDEHYIVEGDNCVPLLHSVSLYRKQQSQTPKTPARVISRIPDVSDSASSYSSSDEREAVLVQDKIKRLLDDVQKQQTIIGQASQALNLCNSTIEFSGSREQVEGERLLLVATHRRQAALNEVQRLKVEGTLRPVVPGAPEVQESGSLTISAITLPLKRDFFRHVEPETCLHFVCLVRHLETVIATPVVQAEPGDSCLRFPSTLKLQDLYSDFKVTIEVYSLQTRAEILPHEIKYHIHNSGSNGSSGSSNHKKNGGKTPKKFLKQESKLVMPHLQSPAGPSAVRTTVFALAGYVIFSLKEVHRQQFTLNKVPMSSPLEGRLQMHVSCELTVSVDHHGFLTMFEDVSGFGAWHRRWCLLKGATLSYWKYPDDERKKTPIGSLDLQSVVTTNVNLVSRDICARPHTFLLETTRPAQPGDADSLVMVRNGPQTTIRHLLSADTKEERLEWCAKLNKTLHVIRAWGGPST